MFLFLYENISYKWVVLATFGMKRPFSAKICFFLELCIVLSVVVHFWWTTASYFMRPRGRLEGVLNFIKEENLESSVVRKGLVSGLLLSTLALTVLTTSSVIGEESKVYAKTNNADTNILMRVDTKTELKS